MCLAFLAAMATRNSEFDLRPTARPGHRALTVTGRAARGPVRALPLARPGRRQFEAAAHRARTGILVTVTPAGPARRFPGPATVARQRLGIGNTTSDGRLADIDSESCGPPRRSSAWQVAASGLTQ